MAWQDHTTKDYAYDSLQVQQIMIPDQWSVKYLATFFIGHWRKIKNLTNSAYRQTRDLSAQISPSNAEDIALCKQTSL